MMFKISLESTFDDILKKCLEIWSNNSNFSLYDDSFNNLDCCGNLPINDFFVNYQPSDTTLKHGEVVFYLVEKLVNQKQLLESQEKSIDSKSEAVEENDDRGQNQAHQELESCIDLIKEGKILKGINNYKLQKIDEKKAFKQTVQMADNNIFYILAALAFLVCFIFNFRFYQSFHSHIKRILASIHLRIGKIKIFSKMWNIQAIFTLCSIMLKYSGSIYYSLIQIKAVHHHLLT